MPITPKFPLRVYYDGSCIVCSTEIEHYSRMDHAGHLILVDVSARGFDPASLGITLDEFMYQMHVIDQGERCIEMSKPSGPSGRPIPPRRSMAFWGR